MNKQLKHELDCMERGSLKFYANQDRMREKGAWDQTAASTRLMRSGIQNIAETLEEMASRKMRGPGGKYNGIIRRAAERVGENGEVYRDWYAVAFIGLQAVLQSQGPEGKNKVLEVTNTIANRLEADLKCRMFEAAHPAYYDTVMKSFADQKVDQYQHKHRVLMLKFNEFDLNWEPWCNVTRFQISMRVLHAVLEVLSDVFFTRIVTTNNKRYRIIDTTVDGDEWMAEVERNIGAVSPIFEPCIEKPIDWSKGSDGRVTGGYHHPKMQSLLPFIKAHSAEHKEFVSQHTPQHHMDAINKMQATKWQINKRVLQVQTRAFKEGLRIGLPSPTPEEIPPFPSNLNIPKTSYTEADKDQLGAWKSMAKSIHTRNKINKGKALAYLNINDLATRYSRVDHFHFVYNCDFRGRIYCATSGLSPQGEDTAKGLLHFAEGVQLGSSGIRWLAIQAANVWGNDKVSYDDRVLWMQGLELPIRQAVSDPLTHTWWTEADKPWQFLAALFEWENCNYGKNPQAVSHIPVGLDGSCNGLQHYSAMLRDSVGGAGVNLVDSEVPADIYGEVASVCQTKLSRLELHIAELWHMIGITRKCAKRPVMTLPYGSTQMSCRQYIYEYVLDNRSKIPNASDELLWEMAKALTPLMWEAIGEVVIAAREAMDWIQSTVSPIINQTERPISWLTPIGFPVWQRYMHRSMRRITTSLCGGLQISIGTGDEGVNKIAQRNGIAPNFVHSIDSTHMVLTILDTPDDWSLAMIHDDFGTHAGRTQELYHKIREQFVWLYKNHDPLLEWKDQQPEVKARRQYPKQGDLNIEDVLYSTFFFG